MKKMSFVLLGLALFFGWAGNAAAALTYYGTVDSPQSGKKVTAAVNKKFGLDLSLLEKLVVDGDHVKDDWNGSVDGITIPDTENWKSGTWRSTSDTGYVSYIGIHAGGGNSTTFFKVTGDYNDFFEGTWNTKKNSNHKLSNIFFFQDTSTPPPVPTPTVPVPAAVWLLGSGVIGLAAAKCTKWGRP